MLKESSRLVFQGFFEGKEALSSGLHDYSMRRHVDSADFSVYKVITHDYSILSVNIIPILFFECFGTIFQNLRGVCAWGGH